MQLKSDQGRRVRLVTILFAGAICLFFTVFGTTEPVLAFDEHWHGLISERPDEELEGTWIVGERSFEATEDTVFFFTYGPLEIDSCAAVIYEFDENGEPEVVQIASSEMKWCEERENEVDEDDPGQRTYGTVEIMPTNELSTEWQMDGELYLVTNDTELEDDHGPLEVGACAKIVYQGDGNRRQAREIESARAYFCYEDDDDEGDGEEDDGEEDDGDDGDGGSDDEAYEGNLFGPIITFPARLIGDWNVGEITFVADTDTVFEQERVPFKAGVVVKVEFFTDGDEVHHATRIESRLAWDQDDDDEDQDDKDGDPGDDDSDGDDDGDGNEGDDDRPIVRRVGHAVGLMDGLPENSSVDTIETWVIGGLRYQVGKETRLNTKYGEFEPGVRVRVKYTLDPDDNRVALKIRTTRRQPLSPQENDSYLFSFVEVMPTTGFSGTWEIGNVVLVTTEDSRFDERWGLLAVGSFVMAEYSTLDDSNYIDWIKVLVPPGAGENNHQGRIERIDPSVSDAMLNDDHEIWVVGGTKLSVTEGTTFDDDRALLDVGTLVDVNSYTGDDGLEVATLIRGIEGPADENDGPIRIFLPTAMNR